MRIRSKRNAVVAAVVAMGSIAAFGSAYASSEDEGADTALLAVAASADTVGVPAEALLPPAVDENGLEVKIKRAPEPPPAPRFAPGEATRIIPDTPEGLKHGLTGALEDQTTLLCKRPDGSGFIMHIDRAPNATGDPFPPQDPKASSWERPC
jgi:hypothetical protein